MQSVSSTCRGEHEASTPSHRLPPPRVGDSMRSHELVCACFQVPSPLVPFLRSSGPATSGFYPRVSGERASRDVCERCLRGGLMASTQEYPRAQIGLSAGRRNATRLLRFRRRSFRGEIRLRESRDGFTGKHLINKTAQVKNSSVV